MKAAQIKPDQVEKYCIKKMRSAHLPGIILVQTNADQQTEILKIDDGAIENAAQGSGVERFLAPKQNTGIHDGKEIQK